MPDTCHDCPSLPQCPARLENLECEVDRMHDAYAPLDWAQGELQSIREWANMMINTQRQEIEKLRKRVEELEGK